MEEWWEGKVRNRIGINGPAPTCSSSAVCVRRLGQSRGKGAMLVEVHAGGRHDQLPVLLQETLGEETSGLQPA